MINADTKRHIDSARQVLVGVVPNPTSQIDQITNALIYKFMDDMDQSAIKAGGDPSFFIGDLEPYAWTKIMSERLGHQERMNLYAEALVKFSQAKQLPPLFRDIFKSAYLPYRSPETLGLFLKEISYFDYAHPEDLGDAYEYLLSIMSSQGDAGQFRTPRNIIDFMVDVVNPTKDDKVLDPACGTGGFLVSSYKHIIEQHDGKDDPEKKEKPLTPEQRKKLFTNFEGYDIDPSMVRIAQVNMYLHQFKNPQVNQYDSLTQEERWGEKYDVILANPPFMSPQGGIRPHNKFSLPSNRSEVLFVDYIMNHLKPKGRAGIIVPEGIIFKSDTATKALRKALVEDGLYAVVSLPSGVFNPYAGVKTSILLFDNEHAKQSDELLFLKVENDGFDLGAQRRPINKNDLPEALKVLNSWREGTKVESTIAQWVPRKTIAETTDYNLSAARYAIGPDHSNVAWPVIDLEDLIETVTPPAKLTKEEYEKSGQYQIIDQSQDEIAGWTNNIEAVLTVNSPLVIFGDHTCAVKYTEKSFAQGADGIKILHAKNVIIPKYLYYILKFDPLESDGYQRHFTKLKRKKIPLPPIEIQEQVVLELDSYQKIIDGARQIVENWKPSFIIDPAWEKVKLPSISENHDSKRKPVTKSDRVEGPYPYYGASGIVDYVSGYIFDDEYLLVSEDGANLLARSTPIAFSISGKTWVNNHAHILKFKNKATQKWVEFFFNQTDISQYISGMAQPKLNQQSLNSIEIPLPPFEVQQQIVDSIEAERAYVDSASTLIDLYTQKTKSNIAKLWSE